jgi:hypothetical protein
VPGELARRATAAEGRQIMSAAHRPLTLWLVATLASINVHLATDSEQRPVVVVVVLHNYAAIAPAILEHAAREVDRTFAQLGIGVRWMAPPVRVENGTDGLDELVAATIHVRLFRRDTRNQTVAGVLGIDAPSGLGSRLTVMHVLYESIGDDSASALALAYVMAHLMGNTMTASDSTRGATIVRAARGEVEHLQRGEPVFTPEEADRIRTRSRAAGR